LVLALLSCTPRPATLRTTEPSREQASWQVSHHFNRNALAASVRAASGDLVSLTASGNLLIFDSATFSLKGERVPSARATCLGPVRGNEVLVGLEDGRIVDFDVSSLKLRPVGMVPGEPFWVGRGPTDALLVVRGYPREGAGRRDWNHVARVSLEDLAGTKRLWLPFVPTVFLQDSRGRLWLGAERGEWGGSLGVVDLASWRVREINTKNDDGIYGFIEISDGRVLAYGGMMHMGSGTFLARIDGPAAQMLYEVPYMRRGPANRPGLPITNVVEIAGKKLLLFSYGDVFEVDATFTHWRTLPAFKAHYEMGRADALGTYPAIRSIQVLDAVAPRLAIATGLDGWVEYRGQTFVAHPLAGQLGSANVKAFSLSGDRLVAVSGSPFDSNGSPWSFAANGWTSVQPPSPVRLPQMTPANGDPQSAFLPRADGKTFAIFRDEPSNQFSQDPQLLATALCDGERCVSLGQAVSALKPSATFLAPDDTLWALDEAGLWRFRASAWSLAVARESKDAGTSSLPLRTVFSVLATAGPPWVLLGAGGFATLSPDGPKGVPELASIPWPGEGLADVVSCGGRIYCTTGNDMYELSVEERRWSRGLRRENEPIKKLGCDGQGRLLVLAGGVWRVNGEQLTPLPPARFLLSGTEVLQPDGHGGFAAAVAGRGVELLQTGDAKASALRDFRDEGDRPSGVHERQAVHVAIGSSDQPAELMEELDEALAAQRAGGFVGSYLNHGQGVRWSFVGDDAARMTEILRPILAARLPKAALFVRHGPPGTAEHQVPIQPAAR
jgi:hypothetical protein